MIDEIFAWEKNVEVNERRNEDVASSLADPFPRSHLKPEGTCPDEPVSRTTVHHFWSRVRVTLSHGRSSLNTYNLQRFMLRGIHFLHGLWANVEVEVESLARAASVCRYAKGENTLAFCLRWWCRQSVLELDTYILFCWTIMTHYTYDVCFFDFFDGFCTTSDEETYSFLDLKIAIRVSKSPLCFFTPW